MKQMIIQENDSYILRTPEGNRVIAWEIQGSVVTIKTWEKNQIFQFKKPYGTIALSKEFLLFLQDKGIKTIVIFYEKNEKRGRINADVNTLIEVGVPFHNPMKPYDNQLTIPLEYIREWGDETTKEILKEIWDEWGMK